MAYQEQIQQLQSQREQALGHLKSQWKIEAESLRDSGVKPEQFKRAGAQLVAKYRMKTLELDSDIGRQIQQVRQIQDMTQQKQKQVQGMVQQRQITEHEGQRYLQKERGGPVMPQEDFFTPSERDRMWEDQATFIDAMELDPTKRSMWTRKKREIRDLTSMKEKYLEWVNQSGYMGFSPYQKQQADLTWDSIMQEHSMYDAWFNKKGKPIPWVDALREKMSGRQSIRKIMAGKLGVKSPMGSIAPSSRREKRTTPEGAPYGQSGQQQQSTRQKMLTEYKRLGGGGTAEGRTYANKYLR